MSEERKSLYEVVIAIAEERDNDENVTRPFKVVYDDREVATPSDVSPAEILRRDEILTAMKDSKAKAKDLLVRVQEVGFQSPFPV